MNLLNNYLQGVQLKSRPFRSTLWKDLPHEGTHRLIYLERIIAEHFECNLNLEESSFV